VCTCVFLLRQESFDMILVNNLPFYDEGVTSMAVVDAEVLHRAHGAKEPSLINPTFLEVITYRARVCQFACDFWEEEPWYAHGCLGDKFMTAIDGPYAREGAPLQPVAPIKHLLNNASARDGYWGCHQLALLRLVAKPSHVGGNVDGLACRLRCPMNCG
jgi:hypothetical protein